MKKIIIKTLDTLSLPLGRDLPIMASLLALILVTPIILFVSQAEKGIESVTGQVTMWTAASLVLAYFSTLIYSLIHKRGIAILLFTLIGLSALIDIICYISMGGIYGEWIVEQVLGTNFGEASEFLFDKTSMKPFLIIIGVVISTIAVYYASRRWLRARAERSRVFRYIALFVVAVALGITIGGYVAEPKLQAVRGGYVFKIFNLSTVRAVPEIIPSNPSLTSISDSRPANVVIIVGESMNRDHCHFDGYPLPTTPNFEKLHADSLLWIYNNVDAADLHTIQCFKQFMSTNTSVEEDAPWNTSPNIIEVARLNGYRTLWLSTQSKAGVYDNVVSKFGQFCDIKKWLRGETLYSSQRNALDGELIALTDSFHRADPDVPSLYFLHLMGSHPKFSFRYPSSFSKFKDSDYPDRLPAQRSVLAAYDNSVLYNDHVVTSVMRLFDGTPTVVIYFSDHGLDIYHTSPDFCEHSKPGNLESEAAGRAVPFVIYTTPEYKEQFPETTRRIIDAQDKTFNTSDLLYTVMDIIGTTFTSNPELVERHSLLSR